MYSLQVFFLVFAYIFRDFERTNAYIRNTADIKRWEECKLHLLGFPISLSLYINKSYYFSVNLNEIECPFSSWTSQGTPFIEISFRPQRAQTEKSIGFTKTLKLSRDKALLWSEFRPWTGGHYEITGRVLFTRFIGLNDLYLNRYVLGRQIPVIAQNVEKTLKFIPSTLTVSGSSQEPYQVEKMKNCLQEKPMALIGDSVTGFIANSISNLSQTLLYRRTSLALFLEKEQHLYSKKKSFEKKLEFSDVQGYPIVYIKEMPPRLGIVFWRIKGAIEQLLNIFSNHTIYFSSNSHNLADASDKYFGKYFADFYLRRDKLQQGQTRQRAHQKMKKRKSQSVYLKTLKIFEEDFRLVLKELKKEANLKNIRIVLVDAPFARPYSGDDIGYTFYPQRVDLLEKMNEMVKEMTTQDGINYFSYSTLGRVDWQNEDLYLDAIHPGQYLSDLYAQKLLEYHCF